MSVPSAAPGHLEKVRSFINTLDVESGRDAFEDPEALGRWLVDGRILPEGEQLRPGDLEKATAVREALRSVLIAEHDGVAAPDEAVSVLATASARAGFTLNVEPLGSLGLAPTAGGIDGALGRLLALVVEASAAGTWNRMKVCSSETCRWAVYDGSRNHSRRWCDMAVCGNRAKARRFRSKDE